MRIAILILAIFNFLFTIYHCDLIQKQTRKIKELEEELESKKCMADYGIIKPRNIKSALGRENLFKQEKQLCKMARCIMESGIDCCSVCAYYDPEEQSMDLPDDVEPCSAKRYFGERACIKGIQRYFEK